MFSTNTNNFKTHSPCSISLDPSLVEIPGFESLLDPRFLDLHAETWTNVPCEDRRFSGLLQLYFIIDHPYSAFVDKDSFLDDLVAGRTTFCSSLLVNALLWLASVRDDNWLLSSTGKLAKIAC